MAQNAIHLILNYYSLRASNSEEIFLPMNFVKSHILVINFGFSGPVVMDLSGFTEKGFKRKLAVQALFGKILYLSEVSLFFSYIELPSCCSDSAKDGYMLCGYMLCKNVQTSVEFLVHSKKVS